MKKSSKPGPKPLLKDPFSYGKPFLTPEETAACLGFSKAEMYKFLKSNNLPVYRSGRRYLLPSLLVKKLQDGSSISAESPTSSNVTNQ